MAKKSFFPMKFNRTKKCRLIGQLTDGTKKVADYNVSINLVGRESRPIHVRLGDIMYRNGKGVLCIVLLTLIPLGCGDGGRGLSHPSANQGSVDNLSSLFGSHPELSDATLSNIKDAATRVHARRHSSRVSSTSRSRPLAPRDRDSASKTPDESSAPAAASDAGSKAAPVLDSAVAKKAQDLIDDILDNMDFQAQFDGIMKLMGMRVNEELAMLEMMKSSSFGKK